MTVSRFFNHTDSTREQSLINDLTVETIQQRGIDLRYVPRTENNIDYLFGEDQQSSFETSMEIEMLPIDVEGFGGDKDFMSKFGLDIRDEFTFEVSKVRFATEALNNGFGFTIPREGDLIVIEYMNSVFEITFVDDDQPFYQKGNLYKFTLNTRRFEYTHEPLSTGLDTLDDIETAPEYSDGDDLDAEDDATPISNWEETDPFSELS